MDTPRQLSDNDLGLSATSHDMVAVRRGVTELRRLLAGRRPDLLVDVGCGYGGLTTFVGSELGASRLAGIDVDDKHLAGAAERGIDTHKLDLDRDPLPFADGSVDVVISFGVLEYLVLFDNVLSEVGRVLSPEGRFLFSAPNLGGYTNRLALVAGYQPREVDVSAERYAGMLPFYGYGPRATEVAPHLHAATFRAMRDLLGHHGMGVQAAFGLSPHNSHRAIQLADRALGRFPSLARRYLIIAGRR